jgi:ubiquinone biosynthesis protein
MKRALEFLLIARRHRLGALIPDSSATTNLLKRLLGARTKASDGPRGERLRRALESLGPVPIKFGQLLSTRRDLLPDDIADELARLQDKVAPFPGESAIKIIEEELQTDITTAFQTFDAEPLAAASVAQVHAITLNDGEEAVVKVLRPGIEKQIAADIRLLKRIASLIDRLSDDLKRLRLPEVVEDYEVTITTELDLRREAGNASLLKKNTAPRKLVFVPTIFWDYSTPRLMVSERISGIPIGDIGALNAAKVNMKVLAERGVEIFFSQVFDDCFFHADMHPGNIFVDALGTC